MLCNWRAITKRAADVDIRDMCRNENNERYRNINEQSENEDGSNRHLPYGIHRRVLVIASIGLLLAVPVIVTYGSLLLPRDSLKYACHLSANNYDRRYTICIRANMSRQSPSRSLKITKTPRLLRRNTYRSMCSTDVRIRLFPRPFPRMNKCDICHP